MKTRVLVLALLALLAVTSSAMAYRLIVVPSGDLLATGYTRFEVASADVHGDNIGAAPKGWYTSYRVDTVPLPRLEISGCVSELPTRATSTSIGLQYEVIKATATTPVVTVGAWDCGLPTIGSTKGRSAYIAAAKAIPCKGLIGPIKATLGYGDQKLNGFFGGAVIPMDKTTQLVAEYTPKNSRLPGGKWYSLAIGHNFTPNWRGKIATIGGKIGIGLVYINHLGAK